MGIILDVIVIAIFALNIFICYKKGLVRLAVGLIAVLTAIVLSIILYKPISNLVIKNTGLDKKIENVIIENFSAETKDGQDVSICFLYSLGLICTICRNVLQKYVDDAVTKTQNEIVYETANTLAVKVINVVVFLIIFIIVRAVLQLLTFISDIITSLPIIKQCNEVGGVLYGVIKALLIIYAILAIVFFVIFITGKSNISDIISSSYITKFFYENNILLKLIF